MARHKLVIPILTMIGVWTLFISLYQLAKYSFSLASFLLFAVSSNFLIYVVITRAFRRYSSSRRITSVRIEAKLLLLFFIFLIIFSLLNSLLKDYETSFFTSLFIVVVGATLVDAYVGRDLEEYLAKKKARQREFIDSISTENKCQSCLKDITPDTTFCSYCGFKQKKTSQALS